VKLGRVTITRLVLRTNSEDHFSAPDLRTRRGDSHGYHFSLPVPIPVLVMVPVACWLLVASAKQDKIGKDFGKCEGKRSSVLIPEGQSLR
jgi:hypothetical protein